MTRREIKFLCFFIIVGSITAAYANTFTASWHFDDYTSIIHNSRIHLHEISVHSLKEVIFPSSQGSQTDRPVAYLTFALNWYFFQENVFSYHLFNIFVHIGSSFFLFLIIVELYKTNRLQERHKDPVIYIALLASLLWALNPIQTQAVTYIVQRMASLAAFFYFAGFWCYLIGRLREDKRRWFFFVASFVFFLLALGTKQNTVVFPVALLLLEVFFFKRDDLVVRMNNYFILLTVIVSMAILYTGLDFYYDLSGEAFSNRSFDLAGRVLTEPRVVMYYFSQIFYPVPWRFSVIHDVVVSSSPFVPVSTLLSMVAIGGMTVFSVFKRYNFPILAFSLLFYFLNHIVESSVLNLELLFEHRNYLPTAFLFWPISSLTVKTVYKQWNNSHIVAYGLLMMIGISVVSCGLWTYQRNGVWKTEESLWGDALLKAPGQARPYFALGEAARKRGQDELALMLYQESLRKKDASPSQAEYLAFHNSAYIYFIHGKLKKAEHFYKKALKIFPNSIQVLYNLAHTLVLEGRFADAEAILDNAMVENGMARDENILAMKGFVLLKKGNALLSENYFRAAYYAGGFNGKHLVGRACCLVRLNRHSEAETLLVKLSESNEASIKNDPIILFLRLENELRAGKRLRAERTAAILFARYSINDLGEKLIIGNDDLPIDTELLKVFFRKRARI